MRLRRPGWPAPQGAPPSPGRRRGGRGLAPTIGRTMSFDIQPPRLEPADRDAAADLRKPALRAAIGKRLLVADGAMGTMLQGCPITLDDFAGHEGCNEILNVTRPDIVRSIHDGYLEAGVDCLTTNTFGANLGNLGEYGIAERIVELAEAGARIAPQAPDHWSRAPRPPRGLGSMGPGTKLPTLGPAPLPQLRGTSQANPAGPPPRGAP